MKRQKNDSFLYTPTSIPLEISKAEGNDPGFRFFRTTTIPAGGQREISVYIDNTMRFDQIELKLTIDNFLIEPGKGLPVTMEFIPG